MHPSNLLSGLVEQSIYKSGTKSWLLWRSERMLAGLEEEVEKAEGGQEERLAGGTVFLPIFLVC